MTALRLIPVIDLMDGMVVHAREGRREECGPVRSRLTESAAPLDIAQALLELHPFKTLYIADLDAIARRGENRDSLLAIRQRFPNLELWADTGIGDQAALARWREAGRLLA